MLVVAIKNKQEG